MTDAVTPEKIVEDLQLAAARMRSLASRPPQHMQFVLPAFEFDSLAAWMRTEGYPVQDVPRPTTINFAGYEIKRWRPQ